MVRVRIYWEQGSKCPGLPCFPHLLGSHISSLFNVPNINVSILSSPTYSPFTMAFSTLPFFCSLFLRPSEFLTTSRLPPTKTVIFSPPAARLLFKKHRSYQFNYSLNKYIKNLRYARHKAKC